MKQIDAPYRFLDLSKLEQTINADKEFIIPILEVFVSDTPKDLFKLKESIENKDFNLAQLITLKLKYNFYTLGMSSSSNPLENLATYTITNETSFLNKNLVTRLELFWCSVLRDVEKYLSNNLISN